MSNRLYDALKYLAQIVLPALGTLYFALSQIWHLPYGEEIVGTITAVDAFLGALLKIQSDAYYDEANDEFYSRGPGYDGDLAGDDGDWVYIEEEEGDE